ncbi:hypothetical protein MCOR25_005712 [Pyricularia grisea]|nr:hypothetical protein MCOR25_005712 [Pyricularia grisea]
MPPKRKAKASGGSGTAFRPAKRSRHSKGNTNTIPTEALAVYIFGTGGAGELGFGPSPPLSSDAESHTQLQAPLLNPALSGVVQVSTGGMHCAALTTAGKILTWGANDTGNLGRNTAWEPEDGEDDGLLVNPLDSTPMEVDVKWFGAAGKRPDFVQVVAIDNATFGLAKDGKVWGWGSFRNEKGLFGFIKANLDSKPNPTDADKIQINPTIIPGLPGNVKQLAGNTDHMLALTHNSQIWAWGGSSSSGELGRRIRTTRSVSRFNSLVPTRVALPRSAAKEIRAVYAGPHHSFAVNSDGQVFAWGANHFGQTGVVVSRHNGALGVAEDCITTPTLVPGMGAIVHIAAGLHHSVACDSNGNVWAWGRCDEGQVGLDISRLPVHKLLVDQRGRRTALLVPSIVPLPLEQGDKARRVAAGVDCSFAVTENGKVYAWGYADGYRLGLHSETTEPEPKMLSRDANRGSIQNKVFSWAGCGGQFGIIAGPVVDDDDDDDAPQPIQGRIKFADVDKAKHGAAENDTVDSSHKEIAVGGSHAPHLEITTARGSLTTSNLQSLPNVKTADDQQSHGNILPDEFVNRQRSKRINLHYLVDNPGAGDDDADDCSSDGGSYTPGTDEEDDTDEWMSGSEKSDEENKPGQSDDSSSDGGAALQSSSSSQRESIPDEDDGPEKSSEPSGGEVTPGSSSSSSESQDKDYSQGNNEDNSQSSESEPSSRGSSGGETTPKSSSSGSDDNESSEQGTEGSSDSGCQRLPPLRADQRHFVDGMGLPIPGLDGNINSHGDDDDEDNNHIEQTTRQLPARGGPLVDGMGLPIPGLGRHVALDGDDEDSEPSLLSSSEHDEESRLSFVSSSSEENEDDDVEQNAQPLPARERPLVDGMGRPVPAMWESIGLGGDNENDVEERNSLFSEEDEYKDIDQNTRPLPPRGWPFVDGNGVPVPGRGYAPDFAVYVHEEDGEEYEDDGGANLEYI